MDWSPVWISLRTAGCAGVITFVLGILAAWWVVSLRREPLRILLDGLFTLPLVLPPTVMGFFLLELFGVRGPVGRLLLYFFGVKIAFSPAAAVLAAVVMSFPLMYRSARGAFEQVDPDLTAAARTLGMDEWSIFRKILMANGVPGVISGSVLAFARGLGEFGATAMIAGNIAGRTRTLPVAVYSEVAAGNMERAGGYVAITAALSFGAVLLINVWALREKGGRGGC